MHHDLTDLRLFQLVVEAGSITGGAQAAHLALASASERLRTLEARLGTPLLVRGRRGVHPTPAGLALLGHTRALQQQLNRLEADLGSFTGGIRGQIRLFANTAAVTEFLPGPLAQFLAAHPGLDVDLEERASRLIIPAIAEGRAEIGIAADSTDAAGLKTRFFRQDQLTLVVAAENPLASRRQIAFADCLDQPYIGLPSGSALADLVNHQAAQIGRHLHYRVRLPSFDDACRLVAAGVGVAVMSVAAARRFQERNSPASTAAPGIISIPLIDPWASRKLRLHVRNWHTLSTPARLLADILTPAEPGGDG